MAYQEVTRTSYGQNIGNSFRGILTGLLLVIGGTVAIFWNEKSAIDKFNAIDSTERDCVEMTDINTVNPEFNGKPIHATGVAITADTLIDDYFGVKVNAISLIREVEYFQKVEHSDSKTEDKWGGATETTTTYTYKEEWVSEPVTESFHDPNEANHNNEIMLIIPSKKGYEKEVAPNVSFGAYRLGDFSGSVSGEKPLVVNLDSAFIAQLNSLCKQKLGVNDSIKAEYIHVDNNVIYIGASSLKPVVGDVRVTLTYVPSNQPISLIAEVSGDTFVAHKVKGKSISSLSMGTKSAEEMFDSLRTSNKFWTWVFRIIILFVIIGGFKSMVSIIPTLLKVIPFLGKGVGAILGFACTIIGFIWTLVFTAIAWITVRPILAISLLVVVVGLIVWLKMRSKKAEQQQPEVTETEIKQE